MNVFVIVTNEGDLKAVIARNIGDAIDEFCGTHTADVIAGVFTYGKHTDLVDAIRSYEL